MLVEPFNVDPYSYARRQVELWRTARPGEAALINKIASQPQAIWLTTQASLADLTARAPNITAERSTPILVLYYVPHRDCGGFSKGGAMDAGAYLAWVERVAGVAQQLNAVLILEPDALVQLPSEPVGRLERRLSILHWAQEILSAARDVSLYIDAGHPEWRNADAVARRLLQVGLPKNGGFALNTANFCSTDASIRYGEEISRLLGGTHFVIDTSRNGLGPSRRSDGTIAWCNPEGRALGIPPTTRTVHPLVDAFLWVKRPGESDGECGGGPPAGEWWSAYALGLARRAAW